MLTRKKTGSAEWTNPDDAPRLTKQMLERAEAFEGDRFIRRAGRPRLSSPKEQINIRLDAPVLRHFRSSGPGWQTRAAQALRETVIRELAQQRQDLERQADSMGSSATEPLAKLQADLREIDRAVAELEALR